MVVRLSMPVTAVSERSQGRLAKPDILAVQLMSETELRVVCKSCGREVSPYVTECPYCGARVRKRAPKLQQRDGTFETKKSRRQQLRESQGKLARRAASRPYVTMLAILVPSAAIMAIEAVPLLELLLSPPPQPESPRSARRVPMRRRVLRIGFTSG